MATPELSQHIGVEEYKQLKRKGSLRFIHHGDEGINHWTDLFEVFDKSLICGQGCPNPARFLLYEHSHENKEGVGLTCDSHSPRGYFELLESRTAG